MVSLQWLVVVDRGVQQAAAPQGRHQALTYLVGLYAPRGALLYRPRSGQEMEEVFLGLMAYPDP